MLTHYAVLGLGLLGVLGVLGVSSVSRRTIESTLSTPELLALWGYRSEVHTVQTDDGYLLDVHRIPPRPGAPRTPPVLIQVGWGTNSECAVLRDHDTLAIMLADLNYDVWLGNFRGSAYGRRHRWLSTKDEKFWDFGWHENGVHDLRAVLDHILAVTEQPSAMVAGHSMGATALLVLLSERPEYNAKVRAGFLIGPVVFNRNVRGLFRDARLRLGGAKRFLSSLNMENPLTMAAGPICVFNGTQVAEVCHNIIAHTQGPFYKVKGNGYLGVFLGHFPVGTSVRQFIHFLQGVWRGGDFRKFDFGPERNELEYGSASPPPYNLQNVVSPMYVFYSENDNLAHYKDVETLPRSVPGIAGLFKVPLKIFNHLDIMYDEAAAELVFKRLIDIIKTYS